MDPNQTKTTLLATIASKNRGILAKPADQAAIQSLAVEMEAHNPIPQPLMSPGLAGNWRLLYTTSRELLRLDLFPLLKLGQVYQCIRPQTLSVINIAEFQSLPGLDLLVSVVAEFEPVSEQRVKVMFSRSIIGFQKLLNYHNPNELVERIQNGQKFPPLDFPIQRQNQQGWLEVTYLDPDLRISRGNQGSLFVLTKN